MADLTHLDASGAAHMVDVSAKADTVREAVAEGIISMAPEVIAARGDHLGRHADDAFGHRLAHGVGLGGDVHHVRRSAGVEMGEVGHQSADPVSSSRVAWVISSCRISDSPTRKLRTPCWLSRTQSSCV